MSALHDPSELLNGHGRLWMPHLSIDYLLTIGHVNHEHMVLELKHLWTWLDHVGMTRVFGTLYVLTFNNTTPIPI